MGNETFYGDGHTLFSAELRRQTEELILPNSD